MATGTKSRRGGKKGKKSSKDKAAAAASTNGGETLTVAEKRLDGHNLNDRRKAVKMANNGESVGDIADFLGTSAIKAKYLIMQQQVEDGDVPAIKPSDEARIVKELKKEGDYNSVAWVACRTGLSDGAVKKIAEDAGHSFDRGRPKSGGGKKSSSKGKTTSGSSARRGGKKSGKKGKRRTGSPS